MNKLSQVIAAHLLHASLDTPSFTHASAHHGRRRTAGSPAPLGLAGIRTSTYCFEASRVDIKTRIQKRFALSPRLFSKATGMIDWVLIPSQPQQQQQQQQ